MSKIPFFFHAPTPRFFRDNGFFTNPKNVAFVMWCFERCGPEERIVYHQHQQVTLPPYAFIFGRQSCCEETGLTENEIRTQQERWETLGLLIKLPAPIRNRFTIYKWNLDAFLCHDGKSFLKPPTENPHFSKNPKKTTNQTTNQNPNQTTNQNNAYNPSEMDNSEIDHQPKTQPNHQPNHRPTTNRPPTDHHNQDHKILRSEEDHHPYPSSFDAAALPNAVTDDFLSKEDGETRKGKKTKTTKLFHEFIFIVNKANKLVKISEEDLQACIAIKGSLEAVKNAMEYVLRSPGRKSEIYDWPHTLSVWAIKVDIKSRLKENEETAERLITTYADHHTGWAFRKHTDKRKDISGVLFYNNLSHTESVFIAYTDAEFAKKCSDLLRKYKMQLSRVEDGVEVDISSQFQQNEAIGINLDRKFRRKKGCWICETITDSSTSTQGIVFYHADKPRDMRSKVFIPYTDPEFKQRCLSIMQEREMDINCISTA